MRLKILQSALIACYRSGSSSDIHPTVIPTAKIGCRTGISLAAGSQQFRRGFIKVADGRLYEWHRFGHFHYVVPVATGGKYTLRLVLYGALVRRPEWRHWRRGQPSV